MPHVKSLECRECGRAYPVEPTNACEFCFGPLEVSYDYDSIARSVTRESIAGGPFSMWRYHDFLPVEAETAVDMGTGFTPLIPAKNLGRKLGLDRLYIKNDSVNPTYSFKDRPVSVTATKALEFEFEVLACVSTGNLMGSVAGHGAKAGMKTVVFFPGNLENGKVTGAAVYGPTLVAVDGTYDQVNRLCSELADDLRWAFVNINMRPFYAEGSKTLGYEVAEQLGWRAPDHCVVPAASGELHTKIWKGLTEMGDVGLIDPPSTRMHLAQPEGCSPIVSAFGKGETRVAPVRPDTIAKSLAIGDPAAGVYALQTLREDGGERRGCAGGRGRGVHSALGGDGGHLYGDGRGGGDFGPAEAGGVGRDCEGRGCGRVHHGQRVQDPGGSRAPRGSGTHQANLRLLRGRRAGPQVTRGERREA